MAAGTVLAALATALCAVCPVAHAAPVPLPQPIGGGAGSGEAGWPIANDGGTSNRLPTGGVADGSAGMVVAGGFTPFSSPAFDSGAGVWVDDAVYAPAGADLTRAGTVDTLTGSATTMAGLTVTVQYQAEQSANVMRTLASLANPSTSAVTVTVKLVSNLASDGTSGVRASSDGDGVFGIADRWLVTSDTAGSGSAGDPAILHVLQGSGRPVSPLAAAGTTVFERNGTEGVLASYVLTVPGRSTRRLLWYHELYEDNAGATDAAACYESTTALAVCGTAPGFLDPGGRVAGLTGEHLAGIVNWALAPDGYWFAAADGGVFALGGAGFHGSMGGTRLNQPVVGMASAPDGAGYWLVASDGGVFAFGSARFTGSLGSLRLNEPVVAMAATPSGRGYWLAASDGGVFAFGDAPFAGSLGGSGAPSPVIAIVPTPTGAGYWLVTARGQTFAFGDAQAVGDAAVGLAPVVGAARTGTGSGLRIVTADGAARAVGSDVGGFDYVAAPSVAVAGSASGMGLLRVDEAGAAAGFGDVPAAGDVASLPLVAPIVAAALHQ